MKGPKPQGGYDEKWPVKGKGNGDNELGINV